MSKRMKKITRKRRGQRTHGYGRIRQHRKGGQRGGKGVMTGGQKHLWIKIVKYFKDYYGKHGFKRHNYITKTLRIINIGQLNELAKKLSKSDVNGFELGFDKVLGKGKLDSALNVTAYEFSKVAIKKIEAAGGKINKLG
ncbi:MAG: uL15 family ribosomal protein [Candidatus Helarchaeota archaeon]